MEVLIDRERGLRAWLQYDDHRDRFFASVEVEGGFVAIRGRSLDELRADFVEGWSMQRAALAEIQGPTSPHRT